ncbi:MAG: sigma-70 family RNA polymerase sigma factor [Candidatus Krumholzibacteria bacterium]|nr:sigma-70 family RNA polymerase sigma factor [Candidatus Krumholzibacteria bacterium]MDH4337024.1 sigma-70 family RNA polymerase sigma factor [Candidatus Krumholzibacteria bacterium]MDH5268561.1 sigma-70 family RNA polymerase sigma factor [Candidatus Krumholzibacteria bacterium]
MNREFHRLAREHGGRIYTFALHALRNQEDAEDVTQEVLIRLWRHRETVDPARLHAWVMRVARNLVIDSSRRRRMRASVFADGTDAEAVAGLAAARAPRNDSAERSELRGVLEAAVADLEEPYRSIVIMREIQDLSYNEIAAAMEMPLGTIKVYLHRARRQLRERVRKELGHAAP